MRGIDADTALCGVIGHPVRHSLSPHIHNAAFEAAGLNFVYLAFEVSDVAGFMTGMHATPSFRGLSVTIPHKVAVIEHLDSLDPLAAKIGSVNTVTHEDGKLVGGTTDGLGALRAMDAAQVDLTGARVLFLGSGGAVRAVAFTIADRCAPAAITILGRNADKVTKLADDLRAATKTRVDTGDLATDLTQLAARHDVIVQGTPMGMEGEAAASPLPAEALLPHHVVFDMVYRPKRTQLLIDAERAGCTVVYGVEMLLHQAALQFERWTGLNAPISAMRAAVQDHLSAGG